MPRPKRCRRVCCEPGYALFKPQGIPLDLLETRDLEPDELEAVRLADLQGLPQADAAKMMGISQPTFSRIVSAGRRKIAECIVNGLALRMKAPDVAGNPIRLVTASIPRQEPVRRRRRGYP